MKIELSFVRAAHKWDHRRRWQLVVKLIDPGSGSTISSDRIDLEDLRAKMEENDTFEATDQ